MPAGASFWPRMQSTRLSCSTPVQRGLRRGIGQLVEVETAHCRGHVAAELLGLKTHGVAPGMRDNVRAHPMNLKRGNP